MALSEVIGSLMTQPGNAFMRMVARFVPVRLGGVAGLCAFKGAVWTRYLLVACRGRMDPFCFRGVATEMFVAKLREGGAAFGLFLPDRIVDNLNAYALSEPYYAFRDTRYGF